MRKRLKKWETKIEKKIKKIIRMINIIKRELNIIMNIAIIQEKNKKRKKFDRKN